MTETFWMLIVGIPIIVWLLVRAVQRVQSLRERVADVQDEMARNPQSPYQALAELFAANTPADDKQPQEKTRVQRID